jgi:hypothetical protein
VSLAIDTIKFDREQAWLLYATFAGDIVRVAAALHVPSVAVLRVADEEGWLDQLRPIIELKKSTRPGDLERGISAALNFAQAHRMRLFLERVITRVSGMSDDDLEAYLMTKTDKNGVSRQLNTRALTDLVAALEKCHAMCYAALHDTATDRSKRNADIDDGEASASEMHLAICAAMTKARNSDTPRAKLFDAQLEASQEIVAANIAKAIEKSTPPNPNDDDNH